MCSLLRSRMPQTVFWTSWACSACENIRPKKTKSYKNSSCMFLLFNLVVDGIFMNIADHTWVLITIVAQQTSLAYNAEAAAIPVTIIHSRHLSCICGYFVQTIYLVFASIYLRILFWFAKKISISDYIDLLSA